MTTDDLLVLTDVLLVGVAALVAGFIIYVASLLRRVAVLLHRLDRKVTVAASAADLADKSAVKERTGVATNLAATVRRADAADGAEGAAADAASRSA